MSVQLDWAAFRLTQLVPTDSAVNIVAATTA
jgi:hypothetical protein